MTKREITKSLKEYPAALTVKELSEILRVSTKTVYKLLKEGALPRLQGGPGEPGGQGGAGTLPAGA